jgi:hypothetical protein
MSTIERPTTVISVRGKKPDELLADPDFIYVGRAMPRQGWKASVWGNPFKPGMEENECWSIMDSIPPMDCLIIERGQDGWTSFNPARPNSLVAWFEMYLRVRKSLWDQLPDLKGRKLGCWCGFWQPGEPDIGCHAVVLARLADGGTR